MTDSNTELEENAIRKSIRRRVTRDEAENLETHGRDQRGPPRQSDRIFCPHCHKEVSFKIFEYHKLLYYNQACKNLLCILNVFESITMNDRPACSS